MPEFAEELRLLLEREEPSLALHVDSLRIVERCRCGDSCCGMFYTSPPPRGSYGPGLECIDLDPEHGMIILDVVDGRIAAVEVLYRDEVRDRIAELVP
jgi:hypothetical protein